ncbi:MAG: hypothetical protein ACK4SL_00760 [Candidatus Paceibacteria bacterium]
MPIVLIIIGLAVAIGLGGYFLRPEETVTPIEETALPANPEVTDGTTVPTEEGDDATTGNNVPAEAGDAPTPTAVADTPAATPATPSTPTTPTTPAAPATIYADGAHTANITYRAPENSNHTMAVTLTLKGDIVTATSITYGGDKVSESSKYQSRFMSAYQSQVIGKKLDAIRLSRVGGASLTTGGFNEAVAKIKASAAN